MQRTYRERRYHCGDYLEVAIYPVYRPAGSRCGRYKPTSEGQAKLNYINSQKELVRLLNANFTENDIEVHLTYRDEFLPTTREEADRLLRNYLRRLKRRYKKLGIELKYVYVTEGTGFPETNAVSFGGSKGGDGKRFHHHVTLSGGLSRDELEALWGFGYANSRRLTFNENGVEGLAKYVTKQMKEEIEKGKRAFSCSKNLYHPEPIDRDGRFSHKTMKAMCERPCDGAEVLEAVFDGYETAEVKSFYNDCNGGVYLYARLYRRDAGFLKKFKKRK